MLPIGGAVIAMMAMRFDCQSLANAKVKVAILGNVGLERASNMSGRVG